MLGTPNCQQVKIMLDKIYSSEDWDHIEDDLVENSIDNTNKYLESIPYAIFSLNDEYQDEYKILVQSKGYHKLLYKFEQITQFVKSKPRLLGANKISTYGHLKEISFVIVGILKEFYLTRKCKLWLANN